MTPIAFVQQAQEAPLGNFDTMRACLPYLPATLAPLLFALLAPLGSPGVRKTFAALLAAGALALGVYGTIHRQEWLSLEVLNPFFDIDAKLPRIHIVDRVQAPFWHWCAAAAGLVSVPALLLLLTAKHKAKPPQPAAYGGVLGLWYIGARLAFEHFAAPRLVVWATGIVGAMLLMLPFFGFWCARRGSSWKGFLGQLLLLGLVHRIVLVAAAYYLTTQHLGTHLDVHTIQSAKLGFQGTVVFTSDSDRWLKLIAIPQLVLWVPATVLIGLVLGALPFALGKKH